MQPSPRPPSRAGQVGMTLLEIMIVLAIIALIMGFLVGPRVMTALSSSKKTSAHAVAKKFAFEAYPQWMNENPSKQCPEDLKALVKFMNSAETNDPWGRPYVMLCGDAATQAGVQNAAFGVMSKGESEADPADDIKSWEEPK